MTKARELARVIGSDGTITTPNINVSGRIFHRTMFQFNMMLIGSATGTTYNIMRMSHPYWGLGNAIIETIECYYDGASLDMGVYMARMRTHWEHGPTTNVLTKIGGNLAPYWTGITYPGGGINGSVGYADLRIDLPPYKRYAVTVRIADTGQGEVIQRTDPATVYNGAHYYIYNQ